MNGSKHSTLAQQDMIKDVLKNLPMQYVETLKDEAQTKIHRFPNGVDDKVVANELNVPVGSVRRIREFYYGLLRRPSTYIDPDAPLPRPTKNAVVMDLKNRMAALEANNARLEGRLEDLEKREGRDRDLIEKIRLHLKFTTGGGSVE